MANNDVRAGFAYTKGRMTPTLVESMLIRVLAHPALFYEAKGLLLPDHFDDTEVSFSAIWAAAMQCDDSFGRLTFDTMSDRVEELLADAGEELSSSESDVIFSTDPDRPGLLYWSLERVNPDDIDIDQGRHLLRRFLEERLVTDGLRDALEMAGRGVPSNLPSIIERANRQRERITSIQEDPVESGIPDNWEPVSLNVCPTGLEFLDASMEGGHAKGEVYGILGPFGVGKTTLGVQLCVEQCRYWYDREQEYGEDGGQIYFFSYEQSVEEIRKKAIACAAQIHMSTLNGFSNISQLSTRGQLKPYEVDMFNENGMTGSSAPEPPGERERFQGIEDMLKNHFRIVDFSGGKRKRNGDGYVAEIAATIDSDVRKNGTVPRMVIVDHVWLAAYRHLQSQGMDERRLRHFITMFGDDMKTKIADKFDIPCWLLHQYNGDANKASPAKLLHHTQAAESSAFAMPLSFCFCIGNKDQESNTAQMQCTKRRRAGNPLPPTILEIKGEYSTMRDRTDAFVVQHDKILPRDLAAQFGGDVEEVDYVVPRAAQGRGMDGAGVWGPTD
tara:strand:+ start:24021 stop:25691 length:1671 start_codon:yes stop_codon:yes gene_type:complete